MNLIINTSSMTPIYEQLINQIKMLIQQERIQTEEKLPSVRVLAKELKISALTVKKAYDILEEDGFIYTVHGKGSYVANISSEQILEEKMKQLEEELTSTIRQARLFHVNDNDLKDLFHILLEEENK